VNLAQILTELRNYRTKLFLFRGTRRTPYLTQADDSYNILVPELKKYGISLKKMHR